MITSEGINKASGVYILGVSKVKNKIIHKFLDSDIANMGVDLAAGYAYE